MALSPKLKYPGQIDETDPTGYPEGKAKNLAVPGDGTGTPWERDLVNDIFGLQQSLLAAADITPTELPDKVGASQYLEALQTLFEDRQSGRDVMNLQGEFNNGTVALGAPSHMVYGTEHTKWIAVGDTTDECIISHDDGLTWTDDSTGMGSAQVNRVVGHSRAHDIWIVGGDSDTLYTRTGVTGAWGTSPLPGTPIDIFGIVYDAVNDLFIVFGEQSGGTSAYIATSPGSALSWTDRSGAVPAGFQAEVLKSGVTDGFGTTIISTVDASKTKVIRSINGTTWAEITDVITSDRYTLGHSRAHNIFIAHGLIAGSVWTSQDGDSWTKQTTPPFIAEGFVEIPSRPERSVVPQRGLIIIGGLIANKAYIAWAKDEGGPWNLQPVAPTSVNGLFSMGYDEETQAKILIGISDGGGSTLRGSIRSLPAKTI